MICESGREKIDVKPCCFTTLALFKFRLLLLICPPSHTFNTTSFAHHTDVILSLISCPSWIEFGCQQIAVCSFKVYLAFCSVGCNTGIL